jgi:cytochrome c peroxidase
VKWLALVALVGCGGGKSPDPTPAPDDARPRVAVLLPAAPPLPIPPAVLPKPELPATVTPDAVALGELLFWDTRISIDNSTACATCHDPGAGYAGFRSRKTARGNENLRRAPTLVGLAWQREFGWDGRYTSLTEHLRAHVSGQLGIDLDAAVARIVEVPVYGAHFARLGGATGANAADALNAFTLTRYPQTSPWDRSEHDRDAPADLVAGYKLFTTKAQCSVCHTPPLYTDLQYHRLGLIRSPDEGRGRIDPAQKGAFKTPSLRGATSREAFFHDASATTLDAAIDWHLAGGTGQNADPAIIDPALKKIALDATERRQLTAFVRALSTGAPHIPVKPALP